MITTILRSLADPKTRLIVRTNFLKLAIASLSVFSIETAHFFGFFSDIPPEVGEFSVMAFFPSFAATFFFYCASTYLVCRVAAMFFVQVTNILLTSVFRLLLRNPRQFIRRYRSYQISNEIVMTGFTVFFFVLLFCSTYLGLKQENIGWLFISGLVLVVLSVLIKLEILLVSPVTFVKRILKQRKLRFTGNSFTPAITALLTALIVLAYFAGHYRFKYIMSKEPLPFSNAYFDGNLQILIKSGDDVLAFERNVTQNRYILFAEKNVISFAGKTDGPLPNRIRVNRNEK